MPLKTKEDIAKLKEGGAILGAILEEVAAMVAPGVTTHELDALAQKRMQEAGGRPAFKGYKAGGKRAFPATVCTSVNDEVVHGIPSSRALQVGDVLGIDIGMEWPHGTHDRGLYTDTALTVVVGAPKDKRIETLVGQTQEALYRAIRAAKPGNSIADIGRAVEDVVKPFGFGIVTALVGHGVGYALHEEPQVPNVWDRRNELITLQPGMVIAIEPMVNLGSPDVYMDTDGWTIRTEDESISAHFEHTIVIEEQGPVIITRRPSEQPRV